MKNEPLPYEEDPRGARERVKIAWNYLKAVACASVVLGLQFGVLALHESLAGRVQVAAVVIVFSAIPVLVLSIIPFLISVWIARKLGIRSALYYVVCGVVTAAVLSPLFPTRFEPCKSTMDCIEPSFWEDVVEGFRHLILPSVAGAVTFWMTLGRRLGMPVDSLIETWRFD
jgi:hypothetical protein